MENIRIKSILEFDDLKKWLRETRFRGIYNENGETIKPYENAEFFLAKVYPHAGISECPLVEREGKKEPLFTPQPTIYQNQIEIIEKVDEFLFSKGIKITKLDKGIEYEWEGRGEFHVLPPVIEKHSYDLKSGYLDLEKMTDRLCGFYIKDSSGRLHDLGDRYLKDFYIDESSALRHLDIFNSNAPIINYGLCLNGKYDFNIICDGSHRLDYGLEKIGRPVNVLLVEQKKEFPPLIPYYALPVSFRPMIRLSSKKSEIMYPRLERDKIHLLNDFIKKTLHYDWDAAGLKVSKLRSNVEIN